MSIGSFLSNLWEDIKGFFDKIAPDIKDAIHIGVTIVENIKTFIDSPAADWVTSLIPGDLDETIKTKLREELPRILTNLKLTDTCGALTDPTEIVQCALNTLAQIGGDYKSAFLHNLAIMLAQVASDGKLDWNDGVYAIQWFYDHKYKEELPATEV